MRQRASSLEKKEKQTLIQANQKAERKHPN